MCSFEFKIPCSWTFLDFSLMHRLAEMKSLTQSPLNFCERYASRYFYSTLVELSLVSRLHRGGSTFCDGKITLPDGPTLLHINTLARPPGLSRKISENALCATAICSGGQRGGHFLIQTLAKVDSFTWDRFSPYKQGLNLSTPLDRARDHG